jgi:SAM-dependent methyltransferase
VRADQVLARFDGWQLDAEERAYLRHHARRYTLLLDRVAALAPGRVLDVGAGFQTVLLRDRLGAGNVDVLGLWVPRFAPPEGAGQHHVFDLNECDDPTKLPQIGPYDLAVLGEVIEHLYRGPATVLRAVASFVNPGGHLIVQTPNAAALHKRLRALAGRPPSDRMPEDRSGDRHVREYPARELQDAAQVAELDTVRIEAASYFGHGRARELADRVLPPGLRLGLTATFRVPGRP